MPRGNFDRDFRTGQNIGTAIGSTIGVVALLMKQRADRQRAEQTFKFASEQEKTISAKYDPQIMQLGAELTDWANDFQVNKDNAKIEEVPTGVSWTQEEVDKMTPEEKKQFAPKGATPPTPPGQGLTSPNLEWDPAPSLLFHRQGSGGPVQWSQEDENEMSKEERNLFIGPKAGDPKMAQHYSSNEKDIPLEVIFSSQKKLMFLGMQRDQELRDLWMNKIVENQDNKVFVNMAVGKIAAIDARFEKMMKVSSEGNGTLGNLQNTRESNKPGAASAAVKPPRTRKLQIGRDMVTQEESEYGKGDWREVGRGSKDAPKGPKPLLGTELAGISAGRENIRRLEQLIDTSKSFNTGTARQRGEKMGDWLGVANPERAVVNARILQNANLYIKSITGAAMSEAEASRIMGSLPTADMADEEFHARLEAALDDAIATHNLGLDSMKKGGRDIGGFEPYVRGGGMHKPSKEASTSIPPGATGQAPDENGKMWYHDKDGNPLGKVQ